MAPSVCWMEAATPALPLPPVPPGHCTALSAPIFCAHCWLSCDSHDVNTKVVPDSSERCTVWIGVEGRGTPGFSRAMAGSFHFVMSPRKIEAVVGPSSFSPVCRPGTLYASDTAPRTTGSWTTPAPLNPCMSEDCSGASESAKSTVLDCRSSMPPPDPHCAIGEHANGPKRRGPGPDVNGG